MTDKTNPHELIDAHQADGKVNVNVAHRAISLAQARPEWPAKGTSEYALWIAAIEVAASAPLRQGTNVSKAGIRWARIAALRAALDEVGVDWRKVQAGYAARRAEV